MEKGFTEGILIIEALAKNIHLPCNHPSVGRGQKVLFLGCLSVPGPVLDTLLPVNFCNILVRQIVIYYLHFANRNLVFRQMIQQAGKFL